MKAFLLILLNNAIGAEFASTPDKDIPWAKAAVASLEEKVVGDLEDAVGRFAGAFKEQELFDKAGNATEFCWHIIEILFKAKIDVSTIEKEQNPKHLANVHKFLHDKFGYWNDSLKSNIHNLMANWQDISKHLGVSAQGHQFIVDVIKKLHEDKLSNIPKDITAVLYANSRNLQENVGSVRNFLNAEGTFAGLYVIGDALKTKEVTNLTADKIFRLAKIQSWSTPQDNALYLAKDPANILLQKEADVPAKTVLEIRTGDAFKGKDLYWFTSNPDELDFNVFPTVENFSKLNKDEKQNLSDGLGKLKLTPLHYVSKGWQDLIQKDYKLLNTDEANTIIGIKFLWGFYNRVAELHTHYAIAKSEKAASVKVEAEKEDL